MMTTKPSTAPTAGVARADRAARPAGASISGGPPDGRVAVTPEQHSLPWSVFLHLAPGALLLVFILLAAPVVTGMGLPVVFALFAGIGLVIVPFELGYLLIHAKRTTGSFSLERTVTYRNRLPLRRVALLALALFAWFAVFLAVSTAWVDEWVAERFFSWVPESVLQFSAVGEAGEPLATWALATLIIVAVVFNGVVGPVTEELYFRGHLLPRIDRLGKWAPVLNTVLFSLYHLWTPWQNPGRIIGFLPISWTAWRTRSVGVAMTTHVTINLVFLLGMLALFLAEAS